MVWYGLPTFFVSIILVKVPVGLCRRTRWLFVRWYGLPRLLRFPFEDTLKRRTFTPDEILCLYVDDDSIWYTYWGYCLLEEKIAEADSLVPPVLEIVVFILLFALFKLLKYIGGFVLELKFFCCKLDVDIGVVNLK